MERLRNVEVGKRLTIAIFVIALAWQLLVVPSASAQPVSPVRINAGGPNFTDSLGRVWTADTNFSGGNTLSTTSAIAGTVEDTLYKTERWSNFSYQIPVTPNTYEVTLHFAEIYWNGPGKRVFDVSIEGTLVLDNFDVFQAAGGQFTAITRTFTVGVTDGTLNINFTSVVNNAKISAIEVSVSATGGNLPPVVNAGADQTIVLPTTSTLLNGSATDDGLPAPPSEVSYSWSQISGPAGVVFTTPNAPITDTTFPGAGVYGLRLTANDSSLSGFDDVTVTVVDSATPAVRINAGGPNFTDSLGRVWTADTNFSGGNTTSTTFAIAGTVEDPLYKTERWGNFSYQIPANPNTYEVTLHFAEIYFNGPGKRVFDVSMEGALVLDNFDIFQAAGGQFTAITRTFTVSVTDGTLNINFTSVVNNAKISAIEVSVSVTGGNLPPVVNAGADQTIVLPTTSTLLNGSATDDGLPAPPSEVSYSWSQISGPAGVVFATPNAPSTNATFPGAGVYGLRLTANDSSLSRSDDVTVTVADSATPAVRINAGGPNFTDSLGRVWTADTNFSGGNTASTAFAIAGTVEDPLYKTERWGNFSYQIPVTPNTYEVTLHFAEIYWNAAGKRVFDVSMEGALVLDNFDIFQAAGGQFTAITRTFTVGVPDGTLNINFTSVVNNAKISAIEINSHAGHPFLHVVIRNPSYVVDYDGNGTQMVPLDGIDSHTHELGRSLVSWTWQEGTSVLGTASIIAPVLGLGQHNITLTIGDDKTPSDTLQDSTTVHVYPITAVGGVITTYHPGGTLNTPGAVGYKEVRAGLRVEAVNTTIGSSPYTGNVIVVMTGKVQVPTTANYAFQTLGGSGSQLYVDGTLVTGPRSLNAGLHIVEARISVSSAAVLPAEVLISINGSAFAPPGSGTVSHDQTTLAPFVNAITPASGAANGGEPVTIRGLGFFANGSGAVTVTWGSNVLSGSALSIDATGTEITLLTPAGVGIIPVTVSTPNGTSNSLSFTYDAGTTTVSFQTSVIGGSAITNPTQAAWGPDGRLYVATVSGDITIYTFNDNYNIIAAQTVNTIAALGNPNILGIGFNPFDAPSPVKVYVAHSHLYAHNFGGCFSGPSPYNGQVSVLTGPNFTVAQPLITGLPVSNHDHGINGLEFDNNGDLLIAVGSNTNAGVADCGLGGLPESPYSAAILKAKLSKGASFNGIITYTGAPAPPANNADQNFGEVVDVAPGVDVEVLAAGFRNPFDLVLTTHGRLYATDNGPNQGFGPASTGPNTQGPDPTDDDTLALVEAGDYYGHPNRNRGRDDPREYVYQGNSAPANPAAFAQGLTTFPASTNGVMEYRAQTFGGAMRGNLLAQKWDGATFRLTLSFDGRSVVSNVVLTTGLNGLDVLGGPGGVLIGVDYSDGVLKIAKPTGTVTGLAVFDIFPWRAPANGGTPFVIGGSGFGTMANTSVTIGGIPATLISVSPTRIKGTIPADLSPTAELLDVIVNSAGQQKALLKAFRYLFVPGQENTGTQALVSINTPSGGLTGASTFETGSFQIVNQSAAGQKIERVRIDLRPTVMPDMVFDPNGTAGDVTGKPFTADSGASAVGLDTHFLMSPYALGYDSLEVQFDNFTPGKTFAFSIDVDPTSIQGSAAPGPGESGSVSGLELMGAQVSVYFDDGTVHSGQTFRIPGSDVGSQVMLKVGLPNTPAIEILGVSPPAVVNNALQNVRLSGPVGASVRLLRLEAALFTAGLPGGGFDVDPFEVNSVLAVQEYTASITSSGFVDIPVSLTKSHVDAGFNYFVATLVDSSGATGNLSDVAILQYVP